MARDQGLSRRQADRAERVGVAAGSKKFRVRMQLDLSPAADALLTELCTRTRQRKKAVVLRNAIRLLNWYTQQVEKGYTIQLAKGEEVVQVELIF